MQQPPPEPTLAQAQRIAELEAELAHLRAEMQDFSYTVSHDLRASLRHILSYAQLVQEDAAPLLPPETLGFVHTIADAARHMGVLMDGLMELSRLGTVELHITSVSLQQLLPEVVAEAVAKGQARQAHGQPVKPIVWQLPDWATPCPSPSAAATALPTAAPTVQADARLLRAALLGVLDNAVKFTAQQAEPRITVSVQMGSAEGGVHNAAAGHWLTLQVQDNGAGFNPALQSKLFKPFSRLHTTQQFPGIGMGLALTRKMLMRMGGQVQAEGVEGAGCTLRLTLPA